MTKLSWIMVMAVLCATPMATSALAQDESAAKDEIPEAAPADVESIDAIMGAVYDAISGPAGARDWDRFRSLFIEEARLIRVGRNRSGTITKEVMKVEDYIARADPYFMENGFFEQEIARATERFGHIAHAFSTYESRGNADDPEPFARGINSFQLMNDGERWWVVTIYWDAESPEFAIPAKYLR